jgi:hypothetical protein
MKRLVILLVVVIAGVAALGFARGWFHVAAATEEKQSNVTVTVDKGKIQQDKDAASAKRGKWPSRPRTRPPRRFPSRNPAHLHRIRNEKQKWKPNCKALHQRTFDACLQHPIARNLAWRDVCSMLDAMSDVVQEKHDGTLKVSRNGRMLLPAPPAAQEHVGCAGADGPA